MSDTSTAETTDAWRCSVDRRHDDHRSHPRADRPARWPITLDRRLAPGGRHVLGDRRQADRPAQPDLLDLLRAHRVLDLEPVVGARAVPRPGVRLRPGAEVPADRRCRRWSARCCASRTRSPSPSSAGATGRSSAPRCCSSRRSSSAIVLKPGVVVHAPCSSSPRVAGVGGGNFASSMTNINAFYPQRLKGWALGLNAGGGNLGVAGRPARRPAVLATAGAAHPAPDARHLHPADRHRRRSAPRCSWTT